MKPRPKRQFVRLVAGFSGLTHFQAAVGCTGFAATVTDMLCEGKQVSIAGFGKFYMKFRKGRVIPPRKIGTRTVPATVQQDAWHLRFVPFRNVKLRLAAASQNWPQAKPNGGPGNSKPIE